MTRLLKLIIVIISIVSLASAQIVDTFNTPPGPITQGVTVTLTWSFLTTVDPNTVNANATLNAVDISTKNTVTIDEAVPLKPKTYSWLVKLDPATYNLGLNDGTGFKQTAEVEIIAKGGKSSQPPSTDNPTSSSETSPSTNSPAAPATATTTTTTGSASSIFSGYGVVFSLLAVAIAMVQF